MDMEGRRVDPDGHLTDGRVEEVRRGMDKPLIDWRAFSDVDLPHWASEETGKLFCSLLNSYIPREYSLRGVRYHILTRFPSGRLYFHLLNA